MMTDYVTCCKSHSGRPQVGVEENGALKSGSERGGGGVLCQYMKQLVYICWKASFWVEQIIVIYCPQIRGISI